MTNLEEPRQNRMAPNLFTGVGWFLIVALMASWIIWLTPLHNAGIFHIDIFNLHLRFPSLLLILLLGNCIPGALALIWTWREGKAQFVELLSALFKWKTEFRWYALALLLPIAVFWTSLGVTKLFVPAASHALPSTSQFAWNFLLTLPFGPLWEEIAWRGYVLKRLQKHHTKLASAALLGIFWAVWHIPLWLETIHTTSAPILPFVLMGMVTIFSWSFVFAFLFDRSAHCLLVVIILHASYLSISSETYKVTFSPQLFIGLSALFSVILGIVFAFLMANDGRVTRSIS